MCFFLTGCSGPSDSRSIGPGPVDCNTASCPKEKRFIIVHAHPGETHNVGKMFELAAKTHVKEVRNNSFSSPVPKFVKDLDIITDPPQYVGTSDDFMNVIRPGNIAYLAIFCHAWPNGLYIGPTANLTTETGTGQFAPTSIPASYFRSDGVVRIFGCRAGIGSDPIAQHIADQLRILIYAYSNEGGAIFTQDEKLGHGKRSTTNADVQKNDFPSKGDFWLIPANGQPTFKVFKKR